jgi:organic hydroperoxide reductase OsmC/OhrA
MAEPRAKHFDYGVLLDRAGRVTADGSTLELPETWAPEHLVLAGLVDCSLTSLRYHALRAGIAVDAEAAAHGQVTRREEDGRYAFVEIECTFDVTFDPRPGESQLAELLARAERDCFVGASLRPTPSYHWNVA